jgi:hypothetical protein
MRSSVLALALLCSPVQDGRPAAWDTGRESPDPYPAAALAEKRGWTPLAAGASARGDLAVSNGRILAVFRRRSGSVELHAGVTPRARLTLQGPDGQGVVRATALTLAEAGRGAACVEAAGATAKGTAAAARFRLGRGNDFVEVEPGAGAGRLRVDAPGRFLVLPDFFADDIVVDATRVALPAVDVPSENFLLHLAGQGDSLVAAVFENREQEVRLALSGEGAARAVAASEIEFGAKRKIWVALLEGRGVWHAVDLEARHKGRVTPLGWRMPFPAVWRADFANSFGLVDSWEMLIQEKPGGDFLKPAWFGDRNARVKPNRQGFDAAVGGMLHPAWVEASGDGFVQPFNDKGRMELTFVGPAVLYPINRLPQTPPSTFTVVDLVRNTLGVGPCEYLLDVEGQKQELKGRATCSVEVEVNAIFERGEQKGRHADLERLLAQGEAFVAHIRGRIQAYVDFGLRVRALLAEQKKAKPELADALAPLEKLLGEIDRAVEARKEKIRTPAEHAAHFAEFRKSLLAAEGVEAAARVKAWTAALVEIGGSQDELVAQCRWVVKNVRQKAGLLRLEDPRTAAVAGDVRARAQEVLRNPSVHESTRR